MKKIKKMIISGARMYEEDNISAWSSHATLYIVTAAFPLIMLIIAIVNLLPGYSAKDVAEILFQIVPDLGPIRDLLISMIIDLKAQTGGLLASAAALTTLWSASKGVSAIQKGLNHLDIDERAEPSGDIKEKGKNSLGNILKRLVFTFMLVILIPALLVFEMLGNSINDMICSIIKILDPDVVSTTLSSIDSFFHISSLVVTMLALFVILQLYAMLPEKKRSMKSQIPGALFTGVICLAFTKLFSYCIPKFYSASNLYGSLASIFLVLLWIRITVLILFGGSILNHVLEENREENA